MEACAASAAGYEGKVNLDAAANAKKGGPTSFDLWKRHLKPESELMDPPPTWGDCTSKPASEAELRKDVGLPAAPAHPVQVAEVDEMEMMLVGTHAGKPFGQIYREDPNYCRRWRPCCTR